MYKQHHYDNIVVINNYRPVTRLYNTCISYYSIVLNNNEMVDIVTKYTVYYLWYLALLKIIM